MWNLPLVPTKDRISGGGWMDKEGKGWNGYCGVPWLLNFCPLTVLLCCEFLICISSFYHHGCSRGPGSQRRVSVSEKNSFRKKSPKNIEKVPTEASHSLTVMMCKPLSMFSSFTLHLTNLFGFKRSQKGLNYDTALGKLQRRYAKLLIRIIDCPISLPGILQGYS